MPVKYRRKENKLDALIRREMTHVCWSKGVDLTREAALLTFFAETYQTDAFSRDGALRAFQAAYPMLSDKGYAVHAMIATGLLRLVGCHAGKAKQTVMLTVLAFQYLKRFRPIERIAI